MICQTIPLSISLLDSKFLANLFVGYDSNIFFSLVCTITLLESSLKNGRLCYVLILITVCVSPFNYLVQTQLYRLTEHFLRKANLPVICRTAVTELAVADAVNIEKQVADRSNSKLVYLNLCSQEISHHSDNGRTSATELDSSPPSEVSSDRLEQTADESSTDPTVVEALRTAGLLSDSPPNSPCQKVEVSDVDDSFCSARVEGPDNIFEMDSHPDVDIYGDFEYDLEDEDYIGSTAKLNKLPEESGSKMKVVFSTLNSERSSEIIGTLGSVEVPSDSPCLQPGHADTEIRSSTVDGGTDKSCVSFQSKAVEEGEELSLAECEELYGPDKEPLVNKFPEGESSQLYCLVNAAVHAGKRVPENNDNDIPNQLVKVSKLGSESAAANVTVATNCHNTVGEENLSDEIQTSENTRRKEKKLSVDTNKQSVVINSISKKVLADTSAVSSFFLIVLYLYICSMTYQCNNNSGNFICEKQSCHFSE